MVIAIELDPGRILGRDRPHHQQIEIAVGIIITPGEGTIRNLQQAGVDQREVVIAPVAIELSCFPIGAARIAADHKIERAIIVIVTPGHSAVTQWG